MHCTGDTQSSRPALRLQQAVNSLVIAHNTMMASTDLLGGTGPVLDLHSCSTNCNCTRCQHGSRSPHSEGCVHACCKKSPHNMGTPCIAVASMYVCVRFSRAAHVHQCCLCTHMLTSEQLLCYQWYNCWLIRSCLCAVVQCTFNSCGVRQAPLLALYYIAHMPVTDPVYTAVLGSST